MFAFDLGVSVRVCGCLCVLVCASVCVVDTISVCVYVLLCLCESNCLFASVIVFFLI